MRRRNPHLLAALLLVIPLLGSLAVSSPDCADNPADPFCAVFCSIDPFYCDQGRDQEPEADATPPSLDAPSSVIEEATSADGAVVDFTVTASDLDPVAPVVTCAPASGTTFALGDTTVSCSATDTAGNTGTADFTVTVQDTTPPAFADRAPFEFAEATGPGGAVVDFTVTATDLVDPDPAIVCSPASGSTFGVGSTQVQCTASDGDPVSPIDNQFRTSAVSVDPGPTPNVSHVFFDVVVSDSTGPVITVPDDQTVEATGADGAVVTFTPPSATDAVQPFTDIACSADSGDTFPLGRTIVQCAATDGTVLAIPDTIENVLFTTSGVPDSLDLIGLERLPIVCFDSASIGDVAEQPIGLCGPPTNISYASFAITVVDTTAPAVTAPGDVTVEATGPTGAVATFGDATATDAVDDAPVVSCDAASGATFPVGTTTVTCSATDAVAGSAEDFTVDPSSLLDDLLPPQFTVDRVAPSPGLSGNNTGTATFTVTVVDTTPPNLTVSKDLTVEATSPDGATVEFDAPTGTDLVDTDVETSCDVPSGSVFPLGATKVTCSADDGPGGITTTGVGAATAANVTTASFTVTVQDTTAPALTVPAGVEVPGTSIDDTIVTYADVTATDAVTAAPTVACDPASGSTFSLGDSTVTCTATDAAGNVGTASFTVTVTGDPAVLGAFAEQEELGAAGAATLPVLLVAIGLLGIGALLARPRRVRI